MPHLRWAIPSLLASALVALVVVRELRDASPADARCSRVPQAGPCRSYVPRWYFDVSAGRCRQFVWGGCQGMVPFSTEGECAAACVGG